jgi:hypothetical protein
MEPDGARRTRRWLALWVVVAIVVWNGVYDMLLTRGVKDYLLREALNQAGRGPAVNLSEEMGIAVRYAAWMATLWASSIMLAGLATLRSVRPGVTLTCTR